MGHYIYAICLLALSAQAHALTILASGQSNMCGRGIGGPSPLTADSRVQVWNNVNELVSDGTAFISVPDFANPPWYHGGANNLALWFADAAARELGEDVKLVLVCKGAQPISLWRSDGEMYLAIKRIYQLTGLPPADVFLWHQGESNSTTAQCTYKLEFLNLLSRLRADGILAYNAPTIVGELRKASASDTSAALRQLATAHPDILFADADGIPDFDGTHFTGQGLYEFGLRYWEKYPLPVN